MIIKSNKFLVFSLILFLLQFSCYLVTAQEKEENWTKAGKEVSEAVEAVGVATKETWKQTKDQASEVWQQTKQHSSEVLTKTKESSKEVADVTKKESKTLWGKTKQKIKEVYRAVRFKIHKIISPDKEVSRV